MSKCVNIFPSHGAGVNAEDVQHKTALHYAVQEHRLDTTKVGDRGDCAHGYGLSGQILLENGADPTKKSKYGDDILQTACVKVTAEVTTFTMPMFCGAGSNSHL